MYRATSCVHGGQRKEVAQNANDTDDWDITVVDAVDMNDALKCYEHKSDKKCHEVNRVLAQVDLLCASWTTEGLQIIWESGDTNGY